MRFWEDVEVVSLFSEVEKCKKGCLPLKEAFSAHANKFGRKPNSVRNYYYHEIDNLKADEKRCQKLKINLDLHEKSNYEGFDKQQEEELFEKIEEMTKDGASVRSACLTLSGGNLSVMTRIQNKYQNMKRKVETTGKIIPFKQKTLTESDINNLFLGLVKLIKKTALEEVASKTPNLVLRKAYFDLGEKDKQIKELKEEFEKLKDENKTLRIQLQGSKTQALEKHLNAKRAKQEKEESKRI